jgi:hypothetical protein
MATDIRSIRIPLDAPLARPDRVQAFDPASPTPLGAEVCEASRRGRGVGTRKAPADPDRIRAALDHATRASLMHASRAERIDAAGERAQERRDARLEARASKRERAAGWKRPA